jgi:hypothetical protein
MNAVCHLLSLVTGRIYFWFWYSDSRDRRRLYIGWVER